jgi:prevent-host-death family protein
MPANTWKLQDAKARFSEVVRKAREGEPQEVTVHGKRAVAVVDLERFEVHPKAKDDDTMKGFLERSRKYRGLAEGIDFDQRFPTTFRDKREEIFDADLFDEKKTK